MKKIILTVILIVLTISTLSITVYSEGSMIKDHTATSNEASEGQDSIRISDDIKAQLGVLEKTNLQQFANIENVMRIYNVSIHRAFSECSNINEILASGELLSEYYVIEYTDNTIISKDIYTGECTSSNEAYLSTKAMAAFKNDKIIKKISPDIEVRNVYYLSGETSMTGTAIYYVTSLGDYIYYAYYGIGEGEYLFPIQDFCEYQKALLAERRKHADEDFGVELRGIWDLSRYDLNSSAFHPTKTNASMSTWMIGIGAALGIGLLAGGILFGIVHSRKGKA